MSCGLFLKDRVAVVTGAARGMGLSIVQKIISHGAKVVSVDVIPEVEELYSGKIHKPDQGFSLRIDVSKPDQVNYMVNTVIGKLGKIDILVNVAGVLREGLAVDFNENDWDLLMNVNAKGVFLCCKYVAREMIKQKSGKIINVASQQAVMGDVGMTAYAASKAAVLRFTQVLAVELAPSGVRVNSICPGSTYTEMTREYAVRHSHESGLSIDEYIDQMSKGVPIGRIATPDDIAGLVSYLVSDDADFIAGAAILITGGLTCN